MRSQTHEPGVKVSEAKPVPKMKADDFWKEKTIEELVAEQNVKPMTDWNYYFGAAKDLWDSDEDFEDFLRAAHRPLAERL